MILTIGVLYLLVILVIGLFSMKHQKDMDTFYTGGRRFGPWLVALAISSTTMSGYGFIGLTGLVYQHGYAIFMIGIFATAGIFVSFLILAKPMRRITQKFGALTIPDLLELRYNSKAVRAITALAILGGAIGYQMAQYKALGNMLQTVLGVDYKLALFIGVAILTVYVVGGGMISAVWTDFIQMIVMVFGSLIVFIGGMKMVGGMSQLNSEIANINPDMVQAFHTTGPIGIFAFISYFFIYVIGHQGQPHVVSKFYMIRKISMLKWACIIAASTYALTALLWFVGLYTRVMVERGEMTAPATPDLVAPLFIESFFHPAIAGLIFAAVMAAIMSTSEAFLLVASSSIVRDVYQQIIKKGEKLPEKKELALSRWITLAVIALTFLLSLNPPDLVGWLGNASWGIFVASLVPVLSIGILWKRATRVAAIWSSALGFIFSIGLYILKVKELYVPDLDTGAIALIISTVSFVGISLFTKSESNVIFENGLETKGGKKRGSTVINI
ncbi:SSS family transporter [Bacillus pakistanensis]|uniref:Sodium/proline symporter n=1 Tax=Rossellomorea pakistanensis TaxID=992288 RepID=A0ABS2N803_9BACI|nr:sodium/proline symporter [Bacillus pakistanensis]MBM7583992.1 SSS family transporter [Bacillus pakistanensis]